MKITKFEAPCKGCQARTVEPNCHTACSQYLEYRSAIDAAAAAKGPNLDGYTIDTMERFCRRRAHHTWKPYRGYNG